MLRARPETRYALWPRLSCRCRLAPLFRQPRLAAFRNFGRAQAVIGLNANRFMQNLAVDLVDGLAIERPGIQLLHARENFLFARGDAQGDAAGALQPADLQRKSRANIQQVQQSGVDRVNFRAPVANLDFTHPASPLLPRDENIAKNKKGRVPRWGSRPAEKTWCGSYLLSVT